MTPPTPQPGLPPMDERDFYRILGQTRVRKGDAHRMVGEIKDLRRKNQIIVGVVDDLRRTIVRMQAENKAKKRPVEGRCGDGG